MKRRFFLQCSLAGIAGGKNSSESQVISAGPFSVTVPKSWVKSAVVERVPIQPLYTAAEWQNLLANPTHMKKPYCGNRPTHWAVRLPAAMPFEVSDVLVAPQILIHKADEWGLAFTDGVHYERPVEEDIRELRKQLEEWKSKDLPYGSPAITNGSFTFVCLKQTLSFQGGTGIRMVCQRNIEADFVRKGRLHYLFLGLSDDSTCQVIGTIPLDLPGMPSEEAREDHLGWSFDPYDEFSRRFGEYEAQAKRWIKSGKDGLEPSLERLDAMMMSLVAQSWTGE